MSDINTQKITQEFCKGKKLVFHPKTPDEARFIQEKLFEMGFGWRHNGKKFLYLNELARGTLYLSNGCMTYDSSGQKTDGRLCDVSQFQETYQPSKQPPKTLDDVFNLVAEMKQEIADLRKQVDDLHREVMPKEMEKPAILPPGRQQNTP